MNYQLSHREDIVIRVTGDSPNVLVYDGTDYPDDQAAWADYQAWLAAGNTPAAYVEPEKPPEPTTKEKLAAMGIDLAELKATLEAL